MSPRSLLAAISRRSKARWQTRSESSWRALRDPYPREDRAVGEGSIRRIRNGSVRAGSRLFERSGLGGPDAAQLGGWRARHALRPSMSASQPQGPKLTIVERADPDRRARPPPESAARDSPRSTVRLKILRAPPPVCAAAQEQRTAELRGDQAHRRLRLGTTERAATPRANGNAGFFFLSSREHYVWGVKLSNALLDPFQTAAITARTRRRPCVAACPT